MGSSESQAGSDLYLGWWPRYPDFLRLADRAFSRRVDVREPYRSLAAADKGHARPIISGGGDGIGRNQGSSRSLPGCGYLQAKQWVNYTAIRRRSARRPSARARLSPIGRRESLAAAAPTCQSQRIEEHDPEGVAFEYDVLE